MNLTHDQSASKRRKAKDSHKLYITRALHPAKVLAEPSNRGMRKQSWPIAS